MTKPSFEIGTSTAGARHSIVVRGELDSETCESLVEAAERAFAEPTGRQLTLDLQAVAFIDSAGMRSMIQIERMAERHEVRLVVIPPPDEVTELLRTAGVADRMTLASPASGPSLGPEFRDRVNLELARDPRAPSRARAEIREALGARFSEMELATVVLLTSELVTNAVIHPRVAGDTIWVRITIYEGGVRVEVEDPGDGFDPTAPRQTTTDGGRGLFLVEQCAVRWGACRVGTDQGSRFRVWFEFLAGDRETAVVGA